MSATDRPPRGVPPSADAKREGPGPVAGWRPTLERSASRAGAPGEPAHQWRRSPPPVTTRGDASYEASDNGDDVPLSSPAAAVATAGGRGADSARASRGTVAPPNGAARVSRITSASAPSTDAPSPPPISNRRPPGSGAKTANSRALGGGPTTGTAAQATPSDDRTTAAVSASRV